MGIAQPSDLARFADFGDLLKEYWEQLFQEEWEHLEEMFVTDIKTMRRRLQHHGHIAFWRDLSPDVDVDAARKKGIIRRPSKADVSFTGEDTLTFVPSFFSWPHLFVRLEKPVVVNYPLRNVQEEARMPHPPEQLLLAYRALGDPCRYQILQYLSKKPRSTGELAGLLRRSEAAVSKHLRLLLEARLVTSERESYYVYYRLQHETLRKISDWTIAMGAGIREISCSFENTLVTRSAYNDKNVALRQGVEQDDDASRYRTALYQR